MGQSIPSKMQHSSNELRHKVTSARQRAMQVRRKASFGNSSSSYEFGGWKSLFEDSVKSPKASSKDFSTSSTKPVFYRNQAAKSPKRTFETTLCPSSQPDTDDAVAFGVVEGTVEAPRVEYLERSQSVEAIVQPSAVKPTEMLRIASSCQEKGCLHFDGFDCRLAAKIVEQLPIVTETLPPCQIRSSCRWWQQEGKSACLRCPQVVTENYYSSPRLERVADPNVSPTGTN